MGGIMGHYVVADFRKDFSVLGLTGKGVAPLMMLSIS